VTNLIAVSYTCHSTHDTEDVVVNSVYTDLGGGNTRNGGGRENELEDSVVNAGEVAAAGGLVLLRAEGEGIYVDTTVGGTGVVLEGLDYVKVAALTLREAVLAVELELGSDDGVLAPAVHVKSCLREDEDASIGDKGASLVASSSEGNIGPLVLGSSTGYLKSTGHLEETGSVDESVLILSNGDGATESMDGIGEGINGVSVVEGLGTECAVEGAGGIKG
jgi:hypothetical protein